MDVPESIANPFNRRAGAHAHGMDTRPLAFPSPREKSGPGYEASSVSAREARPEA